jgi:hypothetical protein
MHWEGLEKWVKIIEIKWISYKRVNKLFDSAFELKNRKTFNLKLIFDTNSSRELCSQLCLSYEIMRKILVIIPEVISFC